MKKKRLQLLATSDVHGYIMPTSYRGDIATLGLAKLATLIEELRKDTPTILIDNGDLIQGSPLTFYKNAFQQNEPNPIINIANALHYNTAIFGNHEFNYGKEVLDRVINQSHFPWLSANITNQDGTNWVKPYEIFELDGVKIGVVGVTTHYVPIWEHEEHIRGLQFEDAFQSAKYWLNKMKDTEKPDITVICYHGGFSHHIATGQLEEPDTGENQGYQILSELDFDIFITGHQHREISEKAFGKSIIQPASKGVCLGQVVIEVTWENNKIIAVEHEPALHFIDSSTPIHQSIVSIIEPLHQLTETWLDEPLGFIHGNMLYHDAFQVRVHKHPYIQFLQQLQMDVTDAPISCTALFHDQPGGFKPEVTMRDIVTNYIFPNTLKVLEVKGKHIVEALEQCAAYFAIENNQLTVSSAFFHPKAQPYNYDMWEGIDYILDIRKPTGSRVVKTLFNGTPIELEKNYPVVMNNYRATGAGNFPYFANSPILKDVQTDMTELIANYLRKHPQVYAHCTPNWKIVY